MDTMVGHGLAVAAQARGDSLMVFDWVRARRLLTESGVNSAVAYLASDYEWTAGAIWLGGAPSNEEYRYLSSMWAKPMLEYNGIEVECWVYAEAYEGTWSNDWPVAP
jgi:hypothetical protein